MSKVGQWVFEMQEDAPNMTLSEFIKQHGRGQADIWFEANGIRFEDAGSEELEREAMMEGFYGS